MSKAKKRKKKKEPKNYIKANGHILTVEDLIYDVNQFDKKYGIDLKHPDVWKDPKSYFAFAELQADANLASLNCLVNGLEVEDYFIKMDTGKYGTINKPTGAQHIDFSDRSLLNWFDEEKTYDTTSMMFRCRFMSLILLVLTDRVGKVTKGEVKKRKKYNKKHSIYEQRIMDAKEIVEDSVRMINVMMRPRVKYKNIILKMHEHITYIEKKIHHQELRNLLNGHIIQTRVSIHKDPVTKEKFATDDMTIYNVLKVAYMLATNKTNLKTLPKFKYIEHATSKHDLSKLIEELGTQIIINGSEYESTRYEYAPMFTAFIDARPRVYTQFYKDCAHNYALKIGVLALGFTDFIFDDREVSKFIHEMLRKGI